MANFKKCKKTEIHFLFDLDGLLVDSEPLQLKSFAELAKRHGMINLKNFKKKYMGKSAIENIMELFPQASENGLQFLLKEKKKIIQELINNRNLYLKPGAMKILKILKKFRSKGCTIHVVSSSSRKYINLFINKTNIKKYFDYITSSEEVEKGKPQPDVYLMAARKAGAKPGNCIAFEDTFIGVMSARAAKMMVIAIPSLRSEERKISKKSDYMLKSLSDCDLNFIVKLIRKI